MRKQWICSGWPTLGNVTLFMSDISWLLASFRMDRSHLHEGFIPGINQCILFSLVYTMEDLRFWCHHPGAQQFFPLSPHKIQILPTFLAHITSLTNNASFQVKPSQIFCCWCRIKIQHFLISDDLLDGLGGTSVIPPTVSLPLVVFAEWNTYSYTSNYN